MKYKFPLIIVILLCLATTTAGISLGSIDHKQVSQTDKSKITSSKGVEYTVTYDLKDLTIVVEASNPTNRKVDSYFTLIIDGTRLEEVDLNLSSGGEWRHKWDTKHGLDTLESEHTVTASTVGNYTKFNFTREIEPTTTDIPTPYISNVDVQNGTIDGEPSSVAKVTVVNPSIQKYTTKLMVHTTGTDGSFYGAVVLPGEERTITVELLDQRGSKIGGEARLYAGDFAKGDGAMDQVEFVGQAGGQTDSWNKTYEAVNGPWDENSYKYENESLEPPTLAERLSNGYTLGGYPAIYAVAGVLVVLLGFLRKLR